MRLPERTRTLGSEVEIELLGRSGQAALVRSRRPSDAGLVDRSCLERLGDRLILVGEARLDGAEDLRRRLSADGSEHAATAGPARLCLLAYDRWGERCVDFLHGDFAFVVWDDIDQRFFAARDRFGKFRLFHGSRDSTGVMGNSLDWVVAQVAPERDVDEFWIADYLTLGWSREAHRSVYRDVERLPPAHTLSWSSRGKSSRRYWILDVPEPLYLRRRDDYLDLFRSLVLQAVADRLPAEGAGIGLSGGLDSATLAASAVRLAGPAARVDAYFCDYQSFPEERRFAEMSARHLGIDLRVINLDENRYDPQWQTSGIRSAEPEGHIVWAKHLRAISDSLAARSAVWFEGEGPDNALHFERNAYLSWLVRSRAWPRLARDLVSYAVVKGREGWVESLRRHSRLRREPPPADALPAWISPDLVRRLHLHERLETLGSGGMAGHPWHPGAFEAFTNPVWQARFESFAFEGTLSPIEWRHPFLDLRVLQFMLSLPPIPWGWKKDLIRKAMRGWLPEPVLRRPKAPLPFFPTALSLKREGMPRLVAPLESSAYVDARHLPRAEDRDWEIEYAINAFVVDHWLAQRRSGVPFTSPEDNPKIAL